MTDLTVEEALPDLLHAARDADPLQMLLRLFDGSPSLATGSINRAWREDWTDAARGLSDDDLAAVIRLLTLAEESVSGWGGGSVSSVIWLFRAYSARSGVPADDLADWVMSHSSNDYLPYGKSTFGARSRTEIEARRTERARAEARRQEDAGFRRAAKATRNMFGAVRRGDLDAVRALAEQGADLTATDDEGRTPRELAVEVGHEAIAVELAVTGH